MLLYATLRYVTPCRSRIHNAAMPSARQRYAMHGYAVLCLGASSAILGAIRRYFWLSRATRVDTRPHLSYVKNSDTSLYPQKLCFVCAIPLRSIVARNNARCVCTPDY
eukprot:6520008-Pyramimonas_sp.AAC.1